MSCFFSFSCRVMWFQQTQFFIVSSFFSLVITLGGMDPTPHVRMPKRTSNLEEANLTNVGFGVGFICNASLCKWSPSHVARIFAQTISFLKISLKPRKRIALDPCIHTHTHPKLSLSIFLNDETRNQKFTFGLHKRR